MESVFHFYYNIFVLLLEGGILSFIAENHRGHFKRNTEMPSVIIFVVLFRVDRLILQYFEQ